MAEDLFLRSHGAVGRGKDPLPLRVAAWVCERYQCQAPVSDPEELRALLEK